MVNDELENIQNALLSSQEDLSHINAQVTELFFVAIPSSRFSFRDFIKFARIDLNEIVGSVRVVNPSTRQHSICIKFQNIENAQKCFLRCHGKRYRNKNDICHVLFAVKFEIVHGQQLQSRFQQMREYRYLQLPLCPSCLERLDPTVSNVWPHYCDELENGPNSINSIYHQMMNHSTTSSSLTQSIETTPISKAITNTKGGEELNDINESITEDATTELMNTPKSPKSPKTPQNLKALPSPKSPEVGSLTIMERDSFIVGIEEETEFTDFVYDNHYTATSAGVCRCLSRWTKIHCPVCHKIGEITRRERDLEMEQEEEQKMENNLKSLELTKSLKSSKSNKSNHSKKEKKIKKSLHHHNDSDHDHHNCNEPPCCQQTSELWMCLICGNLGCGRFKESHALEHWKITSHPFCVHLQSLSIWDYRNDTWQHRLFQKRTYLSNEMHRERLRQKQQHPDPLNHHNNDNTNRNDENESDNTDNHNVQRHEDRNQLQPLDEYSRATVMAKLENVREYYNRLLLDVIQQQSEYYEEQMKEIKKEHELKVKEKKEMIRKLKKESALCDKRREAIELWNLVQEERRKNEVKKKEFQQNVNRTRVHKKELEAMKERYDQKEQVLREQKAKQKRRVEEQIEQALIAMSQ